MANLEKDRAIHRRSNWPGVPDGILLYVVHALWFGRAALGVSTGNTSAEPRKMVGTQNAGFNS